MEVESKQGKTMGDLPDPDRQINKRRKRRRRNICLAVTLSLLALVLLIVILALTVFKTKRPVNTVNSVSLKDFDLSLDIARLRVHLNLTLDVNLSIRNPNKIGFKYTNGSALIKYRGEVVAEVPIPAGKIGADKTTAMNLTLTVLADRLLSNSNTYSDVIAGDLPLTIYTRISGKVKILFSFHVVSYTTCDVNVNVATRSLSHQTCHYKTKL
ncbi:hypothetical protein RJ639_002762 [Escallonia herrerae]|uniref:Late embryogenesis abundant protein LEA-2 subgroup domain-containing protein n=1 Tax=Escallonia herrerae TaxID=1293975 RepID=A0AA88UVX2_9ASTE|nr:hypothetical protein RJ639_025244 [Escallonia herrerae]KAK3018228.1 hypothetical protein RJ639_002762 [Escallonia herrerae]